MLDSNFVIATLKITLSTLMIGGFLLWSMQAAANIPSVKDTAQYLNGTVGKNWGKSFDSIKEQPADSDLESIINLPSPRARAKILSAYSDLYQATDNQRSDWEVKSASQEWLNLNRGDDGSQDVIRFVVWRF